MSSEEYKEYKRKIEIYISALEKHRDKSKERKEYAIKQFDTLMIALSTAGLGFVMNYIKDLKNVDLTLAVIAQILFLCCLLTNLFSHVFLCLRTIMLYKMLMRSWIKKGMTTLKKTKN